MAEVTKGKTLNVNAALKQIQQQSPTERKIAPSTGPVADPWGNTDDINLDEFAPSKPATQPEVTNADPTFLQKAGSFIGDMGERLASGSASAVSSLLKIPQAVDALSNLPFDMFSKAYIEKAGKDGTLAPEESQALLKNYDDVWLRPNISGGVSTKNQSPAVTMAHSGAVKKLDAFTEKMQNQSNSLDKSIGSYIKNKQYGKALGRTVLGAVESLPATLTAAFTGPAGLIGMGAQAAAQQYDKLEDFNPEMGDPAKVANMLGYGLFESLTEVYGTAEMQQMVKSAIKSAGREGATEAVKTGLKKVISDAYKRIGLWLAPVHEGLSEGVNTFAGNIISAATNENPDQDQWSIESLTNGVVESTAIGAATGFGFSGVGSIRERMAANKAKVQPPTTGDQGTGLTTGPLNVPPAVTEQYNAEHTINSYGERLKFGNGTLAEDPNPTMTIASTKLGDKYFIKEPAGVNGDTFHPAYNIDELKAAEFDFSKVSPKFIKSTDIVEQKPVPYQEWFDNEMNEYQAGKAQGEKDAAMQQSAYQPGQPIEYQGRKWTVSDVAADGTLSVEEITKDGTGTLAEITPDQFNNIIGDQSAGAQPNTADVASLQQQQSANPDQGAAILQQPDNQRGQNGEVANSELPPTQPAPAKARKISDGKNELSITPAEDGTYTVDQVFNTPKQATTTLDKLTELYPKVNFEVQMQDSGDDFTPDTYTIKATPKAVTAKKASPVLDETATAQTDGQVSDLQGNARPIESDTPLADKAQANISKNTPNLDTPLANAVNESKKSTGEPTYQQKKNLVLDYFGGMYEDAANSTPEQIYNEVPEVGPEEAKQIHAEIKAEFEAEQERIRQSEPQGEAKGPVEIGSELSQPKQPWQMTSKEYADQELTKLSEHAMPGSSERLRKQYLSEHKNRIVPVAIQQGETIPDNVLAEYPELKQAPVKKESWQMTPSEYASTIGTGSDEIAIAKSAHPQHVKDAIAAGKEVPMNVLEAYQNNQWAKNEIEKQAPAEKYTLESFKKGQIIEINPDAEVSYTYKDGLVPTTVLKQGVWMIDDIDNTEGILNVHSLDPIEGEGEIGGVCSNVYWKDITNIQEKQAPAHNKDHVSITKANDQVDGHPSDAQIEAGNAKKGHVTIQGMDITLKNAPGTIRKGKSHSQLMNNSYGYFRRTQGKDGDQVDVFLGDHPGSGWVFVVDQLDTQGNFDEHKVMMGFRSAKEATDAYNSNYSPDWKGLGNVTAMKVSDFKKWLGDGTRTKQPAYQVKPKKKSKSRTQIALDSPANSFEEAVLQFFVGKGKVKTEDVISDTGFKRGSEELRKLQFLGLVSEDGVALDVFHEKLENAFQFTDGGESKDMPNSIIDILKKYSTPGNMLKALERFQGKEVMPDHMLPEGYDEAQIKADIDNEPEVVEVADGIMNDPEVKDIVMEYSDKNGLNVDKLLEDIKFNPGHFTTFPFKLREDQLHDLNTELQNEQARRRKSTSLESSKGPGENQSHSREETPAGRDQGDEVRAGTEESSQGKQPEVAKSGYGESNKVFTKEAADKARAILRSKLGNLNVGIDPETMQAGITLAGYHIESGARKFTDFVKAMIQDMGDAIKPYLKSFYNAVRDWPEFDAEGMDQYETVSKADVNKITEEKKEPKEIWQMTLKEFSDAVYNGEIDFAQLGQDKKPIQQSVTSYHATTDEQNKGIAKEWIDKAINQHYQPIVMHAIFDSKPVPENVVKESGLKKPELKQSDDFMNGIADLAGNKPVNPNISDNLDVANTPVNENTANTSIAPDNLVSGKDKLVDQEPTSLTDLFAPRRETKGTPTGNKPAGRESSNKPADVHPGQGSMGQSNAPDVPVSEESDQAGPGDNKTPEVGNNEQPGNDTGNSSLPDTGSKPDVQRDVNSLNHVITPDDVIVPRGEIAKITANLQAIRLLQTLEKQNRNATPEEKKKLAAYTGWGGLANVLHAENARTYERIKERGWGSDAQAENWAKKYYTHYQAVKKLLTAEEFAQAVTSTLTAYYTPAPIIKQAWSIAERLGFKGGSVLDPGAGIGHFFGLAPQNIAQNSSFRGYELDNTTGRILSKLYPEGTMRVTGYENAVEGPGSIDLIMTNVPFGQTAPFDAKNKDLKGFSLHNYFIAKGIKQLKAGGIGVFITSKSSMDNAASAKFREWVAAEGNADLIGAIRLPNNTFSENAGTEVTSDMLIFQKRLSTTPSPYAEPFRSVAELTKTKNQNGAEVGIDVNEYYIKHPEMMLGKMVLAYQVNKGGLYSGDSETLTPDKGQDTQALLEEAIKSLPENITVATKAEVGAKGSEVGDKEGTIIDRDDTIYEVNGGELHPVAWNNDNFTSGKRSVPYKTITREYLNLKQLAKALLDSEMSKDSSEQDIEDTRSKLNTAYDSFVKAYGTFNRNKKLEFLEDDSEFNLVSALEDVENKILTNKVGGVYRRYEISKSDIFSKRINYPVEEPTKAENVADALNVSMSYRGKLDIDYIASLTGTDKETATNKLLEEGLAFINPSNALLEDKETYLSGYVRTKLKVAEALVEDNPDYKKNVDALKKVIPKDIPGLMIKYKLGTPWIPGHIVQRFIKETIDVDCKVFFNQGTGTWLISNKGNEYNAKNQGTYATTDFKAIELIDKILNLHTPTVMKREYDPVTRQRTERRDPEATAAAQGKMDEISDLFLNWMPNQKTEMETLETIYNDQYNDYVEKNYSMPSFKQYPGANPDITLRAHQSKAVGRILRGTTLLAHQVGTGKTYTMITAAMEMRRLGIAKKPLMVVNNSTLEQFGGDFKKLYPGAKILVPTKNQMESESRQKLLNKIAYGDWDAVIIPQSFLNFIPDDPAREREYIRERIAELEDVLAEVDDGAYNNVAAKNTRKAIEALEEDLVNLGKPKGRSKSVKDVAKAGAAVTTKITTQASRRKDDVVLFEKMGVDALFVDESHAYKKLGFATAQTNVKGIDTTGSQRALGLHMKVRFIHEQMGKKNVVFATGTPITNTMAELWTVMKFLSPDVLKAYRIERFDDFARTFGSIEPSLEFNASGNFKIVNRFKSYINAPELLKAFRSVADVVLTDDVQEFKEGNNIPKLKNGEFTKVIMPQTEPLQAQMNVFKRTLAEWEKLTGKQKRAMRHIPIVIFGRAKQAAIDLRLLSPDNPDDPGSKTNMVVKEAMRLYHKSADYLGTQAIFSDMYQSPNLRTGQERFNLYHDIKQKLMAQGVPAHEIEIISDQKGTKLEGIFQKVRSGELRFIMGSTPRLGTGVNIQDLLKAAHHIDAPDMPMKFEQRNGRIIRQGNSHSQLGLPVEVLTYGVEKTLDATAYQRLAIKQKFINQMMKAEGLDREMNDDSDNNQTDQSFDAMMSQLSGSQFAILWQQKSFDLRKLKTAKLNHERSLIEAKSNLKNAKQSVVTYTRILEEVKHSIGLFAKDFPKNEVTSVTVGGTKAEGKEAMIKRLDVEMLKYIAYKKSTTDNANPLMIKVNGYAAPIRVTYNIGPDKFFYDHSPEGSTSRSTDISGSFTTGGGFLTSFTNQLKIYPEKVEYFQEYLKRNEANIPEFEEFLTKPFDKQAKLDETAKEVAELEVKMQGENQAASKDLENVKGGSLKDLENELSDLEDNGPEEDPDDPGVHLRIATDSPSLGAEIEDIKRRIRNTVQARDAKKNELARRLASQSSLDLFGTPEPVVKQASMFDIPQDGSIENIKRVLQDYDNTLAGMNDMLKKMEQTATTAEKENQGQKLLFNIGDVLFSPTTEVQAQPIINEVDPVAWLEAKNNGQESQKEREIRGRVELLANRLGIKVSFARNRSEFPSDVQDYLKKTAGNKRVPGLYVDETGEIWINLAETKNFQEALVTVLHEAVAHKGLRTLLGETAHKKLLNDVYDSMEQEEISRIGKVYRSKDPDLIAEEYLADMAEKDINPTLLNRVISKIRELLRNIFKVDFTPSDIHSLLRESKKNLEKQAKPKGKDFTTAEDYLDAMTVYDRSINPVRSDIWGNYGSDMTKIAGKDMLNTKKHLTAAQTVKIADQMKAEGINNAALELAVWDVTPASKVYDMLTKALGTTKAASQFLSRAGIDGIIYGSSDYVLFKGGTDGPGSGVHSKLVDEEGPLQTATDIAAEKETKRSLHETLQGIREYLQDMNLPVRWFEETMLKKGGKQTNDAKSYRDISLAFGRQEKLYKDFSELKMKPVLKSVSKLIKAGFTGENILPYLIAKHALERNPSFRERELTEWTNDQTGILNKWLEDNPKASAGQIRTKTKQYEESRQELIQAIENKDYSGVMPLAGKESKYTNPEELAKDIVEEFEGLAPKELIDDLWSNMKTATSNILDTWEVAQRISPEQKQEYLDKFKYFVPLRGWREGAAKGLVYTKGSGTSNSLKHAEGRKSLADNPLAYVLNTQFQAIGEQVDNEVKGSMLKLLLKNLANDDIHDMATIKKLYYIRIDLPDGTYEYEPTIERPPQALWDEGRVQTRIYREHQKLRAPMNADEHEVTVRKLNGDIVMIFKGKYLPVAQALNKQNYMYHSILGGIADARDMNKGLAFIGQINNFMKATMTSWNVVFPFTNFMRDAPEATLTQWIKGNSGTKVLVNYKKSFPAIIRHILGKPNMNNEEDQMLERFYNAGAATGYSHNKTPEEIEKDLNREIRRMVSRGTLKGESREAVYNAAQAITHWNQVFEDATRFSVFISAIQEGKSDEDAAYDAKEASVNFNRKGKGSKAWDSLYAFFNVALQSLQKNSKLAKDAPARFTTVAVSFMVAGFLEALMNSATDGDDDDEKYQNINPYMRQNYLVIPNLLKYFNSGDKGGKYISIPLPHFWRGFKSVGSIVFDISQGKMTAKDGMKAGLVNFVSSLTPIDLGGFFQEGEFSLAPIMPTVIKPFMENASNRNYMGFKIAKEPFTKDQEASLASSGLGKDNVNPAIKFFTDLIFPGDTQYKFYTDKNGNEKDIPWIRDWNPSYIEHIFQGYTGGTGTMASDLLTTLSQWMNPNKAIDFKNVPFVNKFIRETPPAKWNIISEYYDLKETSDKHKKLVGAYGKRAELGQGSDQVQRTESNSYYAEYQEIVNSYDKDIKELSKEIDFSDTEGSNQVLDLMKQCNEQIKALNIKHNK